MMPERKKRVAAIVKILLAGLFCFTTALMSINLISARDKSKKKV